MGTIGKVPYRGRLLSRGSNRHILRLDKILQKKIGYSTEKMYVNVTMTTDETANYSNNDKPSLLCLSETDIITAIYERRSIRNFTSEPVAISR